MKKCRLFVAGNKNYIDPILSMISTPPHFTIIALQQFKDYTTEF